MTHGSRRNATASDDRGSLLGDEIAALPTYVRQAWGDRASAHTAAALQAILVCALLGIGFPRVLRWRELTVPLAAPPLLAAPVCSSACPCASTGW